MGVVLDLDRTTHQSTISVRLRKIIEYHPHNSHIRVFLVDGGLREVMLVQIVYLMSIITLRNSLAMFHETRFWATTILLQFRNSLG